MLKHTVLMAALACAFGVSTATAANNNDLSEIRHELKQMRESYEARIQILENRLKALQPAQPAQVVQETTKETQAKPSIGNVALPVPKNAFNPSIALILGGTYANLSQDPSLYRIQGFVPSGDEVGPGKRGLNLGESELTLSANIDPRFSGKLTFSLTPDNSVSVEEAAFETIALSNGLGLKAGRFLSSVGYLNSQHAHTWDFVDAPLTYQAFFGGQYKPDGVQIRWLAPTDRFFQVGMEVGNGVSFPGSDRNKNGFSATSLFAHVGDDLGESASWRTGISYLQTKAVDRTYSDVNAVGTEVINGLSGSSNLWVVDGIYKWAPNGNATRTNFKLQGEYFRRTEQGTLQYDTQVGDYRSVQSGWYLQGVYQFEPNWRFGLRYDRLQSGTPTIGLVESGALTAADFSRLVHFKPTRSSVMLDYSPSEFSRFRLQFAREKSRPDAIDNQLFLQYVMSLGAHKAHAF